MQWFNYGKPDYRYQGEFRGGRAIGHGVYTYPNGGRSEGDWRDGVWNGHSIYSWPDGSHEESDYRGWFKNGHSVETRSDGYRFEGEYRNGRRDGHGAETFANGNREEGEYRDDKLNGLGAYIWTNGNRYEGEFREDRMDGHGVITLPNGDRLEGEFRDGKLNGEGIYTDAKGVRYAGDWRNNQSLKAFAQREISLRPEAGILVLPVTVNDVLTLDFLLDSGAADVSIPADVVMTLFRTKTLTRADFLGERAYTLADGSTIPSQTFRIRSLKVGDLEVQNITGSVGAVAAPLLLGQSFLGRLGRWSIDNQRQMLVIEGDQH